MVVPVDMTRSIFNRIVQMYYRESWAMIEFFFRSKTFSEESEFHMANFSLSHSGKSATRWLP